MLFEMTLGTLPFNSNLEQSSNGVFRSIVNAELVFPRRHKLSRAAVDLIKELLRKVWSAGSVRQGDSKAKSDDGGAPGAIIDTHHDQYILHAFFKSGYLSWRTITQSFGEAFERDNGR